VPILFSLMPNYISFVPHQISLMPNGHGKGI